ncbi:lachrymatory-factor synthase-like [Impatiens glandulifera]|uniref:lachrymatory-factor synthase-like n=1 Tax=Impatiens glandulifera TaxID=253017 RepID=UPI001FB0A20C|nr:lachrymatory-factor synthase-like [Impatiens glandulifera]
MEEPKWEGKATAKVQAAKADQVWLLLHDFCSIDKYLGAIDTCYDIEGSYGLPGLIRYCSTTVPSYGGSEDHEIKWCHEKLLEVDSINRCLIYEVMENNMGINSYVATLKVIPLDDDNSGCIIEWSYITLPIDGFTDGNFLSYIDYSVHSIAENMSKALEVKD